jgi:uncharacterized protein (TIGR03000 family)
MYSMVLMAALTTGTSAPDCWFRNHGCHGGGGCYGSSCNGCYGSYAYGGYGCNGYSGYGCYGSASYGGYSCYGGYGCYGGYSCYGSCGCYGGYGCYGGGVSPYFPAGPVNPIREVVPPPKREGSPETLAPTRARLIVELPGDATLYIDDQKMASTSTRRVFNTPELDRGETYYYMLRAEVVRDGAPVSVTKRVILKPGDEIRADFKDLTAPAVTTVKLQ